MAKDIIDSGDVPISAEGRPGRTALQTDVPDVIGAHSFLSDSISSVIGTTAALRGIANSVGSAMSMLNTPVISPEVLDRIARDQTALWEAVGSLGGMDAALKNMVGVISAAVSSPFVLPTLSTDQISNVLDKPNYVHNPVVYVDADLSPIAGVRIGNTKEILLNDDTESGEIPGGPTVVEVPYFEIDSLTFAYLARDYGISESNRTTQTPGNSKYLVHGATPGWWKDAHNKKTAMPIIALSAAPGGATVIDFGYFWKDKTDPKGANIALVGFYMRYLAHVIAMMPSKQDATKAESDTPAADAPKERTIPATPNEYPTSADDPRLTWIGEPRGRDIVAMHNSGWTYKQIGEKHRLSAERVGNMISEWRKVSPEAVRRKK